MKLIKEYEDPDIEGFCRDYSIPELVYFGKELPTNDKKRHVESIKRLTETGVCPIEELDTEYKGFSPLDNFTVIAQEAYEWDSIYSKRLQWLIDNWSSLIPTIRSKAFAYYKECYDDSLRSEGIDAEGWRYINDYLLPEPLAEDVVDRTFILREIQISEDGKDIGIVGYSTWNREHGFGIRVKSVDSIIVGDEEDGYRFDINNG